MLPDTPGSVRNTVDGSSSHSGHMNAPYASFDELQAAVADLAQATFAPMVDAAARIPGSALDGPEQVAAFRSLLQCWTQQGAWVHAPMGSRYSSRVPLPHFQDPHYEQCDRRWEKKWHAQHAGTSSPIPPLPPRPDMNYGWQVPATCPLLATTIDPDRWCKELRGRHTLLTGDLTQYQLHDLMLDALNKPTVCYGELGCKDHTVCTMPRKARLQFVRNDVLSTRTKVDLQHGSPTSDIIEWPYSRQLLWFRIFILNRSPVLEDDWTFAQELVETVANIRRMQPQALIIYRASIAGHPYCDDADAPLLYRDDDAPMTRWQRWFGTGQRNGTIGQPWTDAQRTQLPYGWSRHIRRNQLAQAIVEAAGGVYLDMATSLDLRPDAHLGGSDCLRFCMPGPLDDWATLLYNVFLALGMDTIP
ncbi:hypothetical protein BC940DRAFT_315368 [Gongronella butleri]|nr:hypothetical protein BC940DRAFT_315368 [Gongronella butleri]